MTTSPIAASTIRMDRGFAAECAAGPRLSPTCVNVLIDAGEVSYAELARRGRRSSRCPRGRHTTGASPLISGYGPAIDLQDPAASALENGLVQTGDSLDTPGYISARFVRPAMMASKNSPTAAPGTSSTSPYERPEPRRAAARRLGQLPPVRVLLERDLPNCPMCRHAWRLAVPYEQPEYEHPGL